MEARRILEINRYGKNDLASLGQPLRETPGLFQTERFSGKL
jgi:hypothetical protein